MTIAGVRKGIAYLCIVQGSRGSHCLGMVGSHGHEVDSKYLHRHHIVVVLRRRSIVHHMRWSFGAKANCHLPRVSLGCIWAYRFNLRRGSSVPGWLGPEEFLKSSVMGLQLQSRNRFLEDIRLAFKTYIVKSHELQVVACFRRQA